MARFFLLEHHVQLILEILTDNSQGIFMKQKADKILRLPTLLYYDHEDALLESPKAQNLAHAL